MQAKTHRHERARRTQVIVFTIAAGLISAALAAAMIYFVYNSSHLRF
jgi:hypothetical protein